MLGNVNVFIRCKTVDKKILSAALGRISQCGALKSFFCNFFSKKLQKVNINYLLALAL